MTTTRVLEVCFKEGITLRDLDILINPDFSNIIYDMRKKKLSLGDLIGIIRANQLPEDFEFEHLEEKVYNHLENY